MYDTKTPQARLLLEKTPLRTDVYGFFPPTYNLHKNYLYQSLPNIKLITPYKG